MGCEIFPKTGCVAPRLFIGICLAWATMEMGYSTIALAQQSNVAVDSNGNATATSILNSTTANGRIGGHVYDGSMRPGQAQDSRFSTGFATYGSAGNVMGIDRTNTSRFNAGSSAFQSKMNYDLLTLRNQFYKSKEELNARRLAEQQKKDNTPRLVTAAPPAQFPYAIGRQPRYGRSQEQLQANTIVDNSNLLPMDSQPSAPQASSSDARAMALQELWMRGRAPQTIDQRSSAGIQGQQTDVRRNVGDLSSYGYADNASKSDIDVSRLGGAVGDEHGGVWSFPRVRSTEDNRQQFIEYLETQLLRNPNVNPLSPIQVEYQNGTATIRGVVPTPSARIAAGQILLADPRINRVNNLITYVREDDPAQVPNTSSQTPSNVPTGK